MCLQPMCGNWLTAYDNYLKLCIVGLIPVKCKYVEYVHLDTKCDVIIWVASSNQHMLFLGIFGNVLENSFLYSWYFSTGVCELAVACESCP